LYSKKRIDVDPLFATARRGVESFLTDDAPLVVALDDSLLRKTGRNIPGTAWRRDPLGPKFQTNFVWAQRVMQLSAALPINKDGAARMIPIAFVQAPTPKKPKKDAPTEEWVTYRKAQRAMALGEVASQQIKRLVAEVSRPVHVCVDGSFTNSTVLKQLPESVCLIGRIRADAELFQACSPRVGGRGRPNRYGPPLPTPDEMRQDDRIPWRTVRAYAAGQQHEFRVKEIRRVKWRCAGAGRELSLVIIAPLGYRLSKHSRVLYRKPAYLICTDPSLNLEQLLQEYVWRWGIEVNFRDEKSLLGVGEAQVWNPLAVETQPATAVASYSLLLLAAAKTFGADGIPDGLPQPRWRRNLAPARASTQSLIAQLRYETWARALDANLCGFKTRHIRDTKPQKMPSAVASAVLYTRRA
jgi:hypothetical protein